MNMKGCDVETILDKLDMKELMMRPDSSFSFIKNPTAQFVNIVIDLKNEGKRIVGSITMHEYENIFVAMIDEWFRKRYYS